MVNILEKKNLFDVDFKYNYRLLQRTIKAFRAECYFVWVDSLKMIRITIHIFTERNIDHSGASNKAYMFH